LGGWGGGGRRQNLLTRDVMKKRQSNLIISLEGNNSEKHFDIQMQKMK
jgi:hypothetical protein